MLKKLLVGAVVTLLAVALPAVAAKKVVHKKDLPVMTRDSMAWYSTGIGADAREVVVRGFPLKLIFANSKGELLTGVTVRLMKGTDSVLEVSNAGPWLFVDVPAGTYDVRAKVNGNEAVRKGVQVPGKGVAIITLHWPVKKSK